jgi:colanic acid biosynthesis glycosyl transferase WcaI
LPSKIPVLLASGCPIIGSVPSTGTAATAIQNSGGGVVVAPENPQALANQIKDFYFNQEQLKILAENGRKYAETHYCFGLALDKYENLFNNLIKQ